MNDNATFEMFKKSGNNACRALVRRAESRIGSMRKTTEEDVIEILAKGLNKIYKTHREVFDSEPPYHICHYVNAMLEREGYAFEIDSYDLVSEAFKLRGL